MKKNILRSIVWPVVNIAGVVIHEFSHKFFCDISGVKVDEVCYFRFGNPAGYVRHYTPKKLYQSFLVVMGPLLLGSLISLGLFYFIIYSYEINVLTIIALWFGISIAIHSFPSSADAKVLLTETHRHVLINKNPLAVLTYPFVLIIMILNFLKRYYLDFIYAGFLFTLAWYITKILS